MSETENDKQDQDLKSTELTAIIGREKFDLLADVVGQQAWADYREEYAAAANLEVVTTPCRSILS
jgi:hypothetical protein